MSGPKPWRTRARQTVLDAAPWLTVWREAVELPDGSVVDDFYQAQASDFALIYATTAAGEVVLLRQYRHGARQIGVCFPGGHVDAGEDPAATALRELREETGFVADAVEPRGRFVMHSNLGLGWGSFWRAHNARRVGTRATDDLEDAEVLLATPAEVEAFVASGAVVTCHDAMCALLGLRDNVLHCSTRDEGG